MPVYNLPVLLAELQVDEGYREFVYDDATGKTSKVGDTIKGNLTIGIGRDLMTNGLTVGEAKMLLLNDINLVNEWIDKFLPWWSKLTDGRQRALVNMIFNLGTTGIKSFKMFLAKLQAEDYEGAAQELESSLWFKQVGDRAQRIVNLIRHG